jgi:hypothetical protein
MEWMPPWVARAYARLYAAKRMDTFDFSEAGRILELKDKRQVAKRLTRLKTSGHLTARRDPVDPRRKLFKLVDPESIVLAVAIQSRAKTTDVSEKLKAASGVLDYYVNGAHAAYQYHHYLAPGRIDISVRTEQLPTWIALLSEEDVAISIDETPAEHPAETIVSLRSGFDEKFSEHVRVIDGIKYLSPEVLVILGVTRDRPAVEDVLAILVVQRAKLDWKVLTSLSEAYNATRFVGCLLDVLNSEMRKPLFPTARINKLLRQSNLQARLDFPIGVKGEPAEERYATISSKWNVRLRLSHAVVSKILIDLVRV